MIIRNKVAISFIVAFVLAIVLALISPTFNSAIKNGSAVEFTHGWSIEDENGHRENFNGFGQTTDSRKIVLIHAHDQELNAIDALGIYNYYSAVSVYSGNKMIYQYGSIDDLENNVFLGNYYSIIDIHRHDMEEAEIKVVFESREPQTIYAFKGGTGGALEMEMVREYFFALITPIMTLLFIIVSFVIGIKETTKDLITEKHIWLLVFASMISIWQLVDTQIFMDLGFKAGGVCLVSFEVYMLLPIPLLMLINKSCRRFKKLDLLLCNVVFINFIVLTVLHFAHIRSFLQTLLPTHIIVAVGLVVCMAQVIIEYRERSTSQNFLLLIGYVTFFILAVVQYLSFFINPATGNSTILQFGVIVFLILQISGVLATVNKRIGDVARRLEEQTAYLKETFSSLVPDERLSSILETEGDITESGGMKYITVLESDIRGFTQLTQGMNASDVIGMLNHYLAAMTNIIRRHDGIVLEFVGDAVVAIFDKEHSGENHANKAVITAVEMQYIMDDINEWNAAHHYPLFEMGIGIHSGDTYVGYIGSENRMEYDAIGSTMNLVSRIEGYSTGGQILVSGECMKNIDLNLVILDEFNILPKGYTENISISVIGGLGEPYNIVCDNNEDRTIPLKNPIKTIFNMVYSKRTEQIDYEGYITEASRTHVVLNTAVPLKLFDNIRISEGDYVFGKVVSRSRKGYLIRCTTTLEDFDSFEFIDLQREE